MRVHVKQVRVEARLLPRFHDFEQDGEGGDLARVVVEELVDVGDYEPVVEGVGQAEGFEPYMLERLDRLFAREYVALDVVLLAEGGEERHGVVSGVVVEHEKCGNAERLVVSDEGGEQIDLVLALTQQDNVMLSDRWREGEPLGESSRGMESVKIEGFEGERRTGDGRTGEGRTGAKRQGSRGEGSSATGGKDFRRRRRRSRCRRSRCRRSLGGRVGRDVCCRTFLFGLLRRLRSEGGEHAGEIGHGKRRAGG